MNFKKLDNGTIVVELSERNLLTLLAKLNQPDSFCTLYKDCADGRLVVQSVPDKQHYGDRKPGPVHPLSEEAVRKYKEGRH